MKRVALLFFTALLLICPLLSNAQTIAFIGTDSTTNSNTQYPSPYGQWFTCSKHQMLILSSELLAAGVNPGLINSLGFNVLLPNGVALQDFTIKMKMTSATSLSAFDNTNLTTVYGPTDYVDVIGWNIHTFTSGFFWDGGSNIIVETCFCNGVSNWTNNAEMFYSVTGFNSTIYSRTDGDATHCVNASGPTTSSNRPNLRFDGAPPPPIDAGVISITSPIGGCALSDSEMVSITVQNFGSDTITSLDVYYSLNGGVPIMETITDTLVLGSTVNHMFALPVDLSATGIYSFDAWTDLTNDNFPVNDSTTNYLVEHFLGISFLPKYDIEQEVTCLASCASACPLLGAWINSTDDDMDWTVNAGGTSSSNTGPGVDNTTGLNSGKYLYLEASGACSPTKTAILQSPCLSLDNFITPTLNFAYHMYGGNMGELHIEIDTGGGGWLDIFTVIGEVQTANNDPWTIADIDLTIYSNVERLRFKGVTGIGFTSDMAIDDIRIYDKPTDDVGVAGASSPFSGCDLGTTESIIIEVENVGINVETAIPVGYSINGGAAVLDTLFDTLVPGASTIFTFAATADLSVPGTYNFKIWTSLTVDTLFNNDSLLQYQVIHAAPITAYPIIENFDSESPCATTCGAACTSTGMWTNDITNDDIDWANDENGTPSGGTGPLFDNTLGTSVGNYLYTESSGCNAMVASLLSPCVDNSLMTNPTLAFSYHMFGTGTGNIFVDVLSGGSWTTVDSIIGQQQTVQADPWIARDVDLSAFTGIIRLRIRGVTGAGATSDMAIDDLVVFDKPGKDVGVIAIDGPVTGCLSAGDTVVVRVANFGADAQDTIPVTYSLDGGTPVTENILVNLLPSDTLTYSFTTLADFSAAGNHSLSAWTILSGDARNDNDSTADGAINNSSTLADFTVSNVLNCVGAQNTFTDISTNAPSTWDWDFGNGDTSNAQNPVYAYNDTGVYTITLIVSNACNMDTMIQTSALMIAKGPKQPDCVSTVADIANDIGIASVTFNTINNNTNGIQEGYSDYSCVNFTTVMAGSKQTLTVQTGPGWAENVRAWIDFNNDSVFASSELVATSDNRLVNHSVDFFIPAGTVVGTMLRMRVASDYIGTTPPTVCGNLQFGQTEDYGVSIVPNTNAPVAEFNFSIVDNCLGAVEFYNNSSFFPTTSAWDFGDGNTAVGDTVTHTFGTGAFTVTLIAGNGFGADTTTQLVTIDSIVAGFSVPDTVFVGDNILFSNTGSGADTWAWDFGDFLASSLENPSHSYAVAGTYSVVVSATNSVTGCVDTYTKQIVVVLPPLVGILSLGTKDEITVAPMPSTGEFFVNYKIDGSHVVEVTIRDMMGRVVFNRNASVVNEHKQTIDLKDQPKGMYFINVVVTDGRHSEGAEKSYMLKIILE